MKVPLLPTSALSNKNNKNNNNNTNYWVVLSTKTILSLIDCEFGSLALLFTQLLLAEPITTAYCVSINCLMLKIQLLLFSLVITVKQTTVIITAPRILLPRPT
jgi:hypothetical protein